MKQHLISFTLLLVSLLCVVPARASDTFVPCRPGADVFFVNGVNKPNEQSVAADADELRQNVAHFSVTCVADVDYLYNPSQNLVYDLLVESAVQKATELGAAFGDVLLQVAFAATGRVSSLSPADQDQIRARITTLIQGITLNSPISMNGATVPLSQLVNQFRDRVLTHLGNGTKTILVAHSQGNFFANEVYNAVQARGTASVSQGLAIVNVANASINAPSGLWVTAAQDLVIFALGDFALPGNRFDATGAYAYDLTGHGFSPVYLNRSLPDGTVDTNSIAARVMSLLQEAIAVAQTPVATFFISTSFNLWQLNLSTNVATLYGAFSFANSPRIAVWDIAQSSSGLTYAISANALYLFDTTSLSLFRLPQSTVGGNALTFNADGELYGMGGNKIYRFDPVTGVATELPVSLGSYVSSGDLTFDSDGNLFAAAVGPGGVDSLIRIDLNRSIVTVVGSTGYSAVYGLYFSAGYLYGVTNSGLVLNIDRVTGAAQPVRQLPFGDVTGLQ